MTECHFGWRQGKPPHGAVAVHFPDAAMVSALPTPLSCNHIDTIVMLKTPQVRQFECWSSDICGRKLRPPGHMPAAGRTRRKRRGFLCGGYAGYAEIGDGLGGGGVFKQRWGSQQPR